MAGVDLVDPLGQAILTPQLGVTLVEGIGLDPVIADLAPGVGPTGQLGLVGHGARLLVEGVAVAGEAEAVDGPTAEIPAPVGGGDGRGGWHST